jgi:hypothetical protein
VAVIAYGGEDASSTGVLAAGTACLLIAAATIWGVRVSTRGAETMADSGQLGQP